MNAVHPARPSKTARMSQVLSMAGAVYFLVAVMATPVLAQTDDTALSDPLRHPGWNYGGQLWGGFTVVQVSSPAFITANRNITNLALALRIGRVLTREHGSGWVRGTFEWDFNVVPVEIFWVLGSHYAGGFEAFGPRWNLTGNRRRIVPFAGIAGGMLFSPQNFPPGETYQANFTIAVDAGVHMFARRHRSVDVAGRLYHLSNAYLGRQNPGIPVGMQFTLGYSWY